MYSFMLKYHLRSVKGRMLTSFTKKQCKDNLLGNLLNKTGRRLFTKSQAHQKRDSTIVMSFNEVEVSTHYSKSKIDKKYTEDENWNKTNLRKNRIAK